MINLSFDLFIIKTVLNIGFHSNPGRKTIINQEKTGFENTTKRIAIHGHRFDAGRFKNRIETVEQSKNDFQWPPLFGGWVRRNFDFPHNVIASASGHRRRCIGYKEKKEASSRKHAAILRKEGFPKTMLYGSSHFDTPLLNRKF